MKSERRLAASVIIDAVETLQPLLNSKCGDTVYFNAIEAMVWLYTSTSDIYFEILDLDPGACRAAIDLSFHAEMALSTFEKRRDTLRRMYFAMVRYGSDTKPEISYEIREKYVDDTIRAVEHLLRRIKEGPRGTGRRRIPAFLNSLCEVTAGEGSLQSA